MCILHKWPSYLTCTDTNYYACDTKQDMHRIMHFSVMLDGSQRHVTVYLPKLERDLCLETLTKLKYQASFVSCSLRDNLNPEAIQSSFSVGCTTEVWNNTKILRSAVSKWKHIVLPLKMKAEDKLGWQQFILFSFCFGKQVSILTLFFVVVVFQCIEPLHTILLFVILNTDQVIQGSPFHTSFLQSCTIEGELPLLLSLQEY